VQFLSQFYKIESIRYSLFFHAGYNSNGEAPISSTNKPLKSGNGMEPRSLETDEIPSIINDFRIAARNAMEAGINKLYELIVYMHIS